MTATSDWHTAKRILCIRLDGLGDVLMTTPAIRALSASRHITLLTSSAGAVVAQLVPEVDDVLVYDAPWVKTPAAAAAEADLRMIQQLRAGGFDSAVVFTTCSQSALPAALLCYLAGIPLRLAYCHENPYYLLTNWVRDPEHAGSLRHEVRRQLDLVATVGAFTSDERLSLHVPQSAFDHVRHVLRLLSVDPHGPWVCVHPGASAPSRRYAPALFAAAADAVYERTGYPIVLAGGREDVEAADGVRHAMRYPAISLAGQLDLPELAALIGQAKLLVANNSGPAHVAAAMGTPVVDLYALTNPQHTPWQVDSRVLSHAVPCRNCLQSVCPLGHNGCLQWIPPAAVADAACELLEHVCLSPVGAGA